MPAGMIDEDAAHERRGDGKEMSAVLPADAALVDQLLIRLVNESSRLQSMVAALRLERPRGQTAQLLVDQGD